MKFTRECPFTGKIKTREIDITEEQLYNWAYKKMLIQEAMPNVSPSDREFIMTGIDEEEWNKMFKEI